MTRLFIPIFVLALALHGSACGDDAGTDGSGSDLSGENSEASDECTASCEGGTPSTYPSGPYASDESVVGKTLPDITFTTPEGESKSFSDLREAGGKTLMLISTTAGWCTACIEEQPKLEGFYQKYGCDGLEVLVAIFEDLNFNPATAANAKEWQLSYGLSFPVVADTDNALGDFYDTGAAPLNMLVDLCTMEVLYSGVGFDESAVTALIESNL